MDFVLSEHFLRVLGPHVLAGLERAFEYPEPDFTLSLGLHLTRGLVDKVDGVTPSSECNMASAVVLLCAVLT
jgi:hypothetical protein